jgi:hydroxymethylglutaryl-CoA reductase (NADPH)
MDNRLESTDRSTDMPTDSHRASCFLQRLLRDQTLDQLRERLKAKRQAPARRLPSDPQAPPEARAALLDPQTLEQMACYQHHVENFLGCVKLPVGVAGPLRVNGLFAQGDYYIPLATTEAALVASYSRGAQLISEAGGCTAMLINEGMSRAPGFAFARLEEAGAFVAWAVSHLEEFAREAEATTRHGRLIDMRVALEGNHVYLNFEFTTGDASGQNMVTIATAAICEYIHAHSPVRACSAFVEANLSGDKKASAQSFLSVRGRKVTAEAILSADLVERRLRATPPQMADYWRMSAIGGVLSGTLGVHGHYANGLAALYIACGQDAACVAESAVGITRFEVTDHGELYAAVTLPNLTVGTVGGGTGLPSQRACLEILGLAGPGKAAALAEVCAGLCLAGELSIIGALCAGEFADAHRRLARGEVRHGGTDGGTDE